MLEPGPQQAECGGPSQAGLSLSALQVPGFAAGGCWLQARPRAQGSWCPCSQHQRRPLLSRLRHSPDPYMCCSRSLCGLSFLVLTIVCAYSAAQSDLPGWLPASGPVWAPSSPTPAAQPAASSVGRPCSTEAARPMQTAGLVRMGYLCVLRCRKLCGV